MLLEVSGFPRFPLASLPTPLEPLDRLRDALAANADRVPRLWIKRDDATGLAMGGNKTRKLEFLVGHARSLGADTLVTLGATQSNHARQTAAAAARAGMDCQILLEERTVRDQEYAASGNVLLDGLLGATIARRLPGGTDMLAAAGELVQELTEAGRRPFLIVGGGSSPRGAIGYAVAADEVCEQIDPDVIVHATGSMGTQAGLLAGLAARGTQARVLGISVRQPAAAMIPEVRALASATCELLGVSPDRMPAVEVDDRWIGGGYGVPTSAMLRALGLLARTEGILIDPVYSGKAMAGLLGNIHEGKFTDDQNVVFIHTGGTPALFAYRSAMEQMASQRA